VLCCSDQNSAAVIAGYNEYHWGEPDLQETFRRGVLAPSLVVSYSHSDDDIDLTVAAIDGALGVYRRHWRTGPKFKSGK
jgi:hypothetical protein